MIRPVRVQAVELVLVGGVEFDRIELSHRPSPQSVMGMPPEQRDGPFIAQGTTEVQEQVRTAIDGIKSTTETRVLLIATHPAARDAAIESLRSHCTVLAVHSVGGYRVVYSTDPDWPQNRVIKADDVRIPK